MKIWQCSHSGNDHGTRLYLYMILAFSSAQAHAWDEGWWKPVEGVVVHWPIPEKYPTHVWVPSALHSVLPNIGLRRILTLANTLSPPIPLRVLPRNPRSRVMI